MLILNRDIFREITFLVAILRNNTPEKKTIKLYDIFLILYMCVCFCVCVFFWCMAEYESVYVRIYVCNVSDLNITGV